MTFTTKTLDELHDELLAHLRGRLPDANLAKGSDYWLRSRAFAAAVWAQQQGIVDQKKQILVTTADAAYLPEHAAERLGEDNAVLPAQKATGKVMATSTNPSETISTGATLTHSSGAKYRVVAGTSTATPAFTGSGKLVLFGSTLERLLIDPDASNMAVDDLVSIGSASVVRAIKDVLPETGTAYALDFYQALLAQPAIGDAVDGVTGAVVTVEAVEAGVAGNLLPGDTLTWDSPSGTVDASATVLEMTGGADLEKTEELRRRLLAWIQERPASGNRSDMRQWARETPDVRIEDACVYQGYRGMGTTDIVPIGISGARITGDVTNTKIYDYLVSKASEFEDLFVRPLLEDDTGCDIELVVTPAPNYEADWAGSYTLDAGSTKSVLVLTAAPANIEIDDRVLVFVASGLIPGLYERRVSAKGALTITLDEDLPAAPASGGMVDPGGPLMQPILDAINALFDKLGPGDPGGYARFPAAGEAWEWVLRPELLSAAALGVTGCEGCEVTSPASAVTPAQFARVIVHSFRITHSA